MQSNIFIPKDLRLQKYIEYFWYLSSSGRHDISGPETIVYPETNFDIILSFASPTTWRTKQHRHVEVKGSYILSGIRKEPLVINCRDRVEYLAIRFYPYGLFYFLKDSLDEINSAQAVKLNDLSGILWKDLTDKLADIPDLSKRLSVLESELIRMLNSKVSSASWVVNGALQHIHKSNEPVNFKKLIKDLDIYPKRLEREFKKYIGTTPKLYSRVARFNKVVKYIDRHTANIRWADTAQTFGYFDQSHFIKEFTDFLGMSPEGYLSIKCTHSGC